MMRHFTFALAALALILAGVWLNAEFHPRAAEQGRQEVAAADENLAAGQLAELPASAGEALVDEKAIAGESLPDAQDIHMLSHRALYDFRMTSVGTGSGLSDIRGRMFYEQDDACEAWTTDHRFTSEYHYPERDPMLNTSHYVSWEAKDKSSFQFSSDRQENGAMAEQLRGAVAQAEDGTAKASFSRPSGLAFDLDKNYYLPTGHTVEIIRHARAHQPFFNGILFDGTDAEGPVEVNVFIGHKASAEEIAAIARRSPRIDAKLLSKDAWHVRMAIFPLADREGMSPTYEMDMILHDNGVVSDAVVDYQLFKVGQRLEALESLPETKCP